MARSRVHQLSAAEEPPPMLERLVFFSDAVFAIAITLLIIEIEVPHLPREAGVEAHLSALTNLIPHLIGFFVSFAVIGAFWSGHHRAFGLATHYGPGLLFLNMAMLCAIVFMPFVTAYMSENFGALVPTALYNAVLLLTGILNLLLIRRVTGAPFVGTHVSKEEIAITRARGWGVTAGAVLALTMSFIAPLFAQYMLITIPLWMTLAIGIAKRRLARASS